MKMIMPLRFVFLILGLLTLQACTSQSSDDSVKKGWLDNLNAAQTESVKANKPILISFTNSDTCGLCKQMDANVFSTPTFKTWAEKYVVLLEVDFANQDQLDENHKVQNAAMAQSLKVSSYPTTWILSIAHEPENNRFKVKPVGTVGYQATPEKFIGLLQNLIRR